MVVVSKLRIGNIEDVTFWLASQKTIEEAGDF
jgi:hypothetical protein